MCLSSYAAAFVSLLLVRTSFGTIVLFVRMAQCFHDLLCFTRADMITFSRQIRFAKLNVFSSIWNDSFKKYINTYVYILLLSLSNVDVHVEVYSERVGMKRGESKTNMLDYVTLYDCLWPLTPYHTWKTNCCHELVGDQWCSVLIPLSVLTLLLHLFPVGLPRRESFPPPPPTFASIHLKTAAFL